jgi:hypothetical protein
MIPFDRIVNHDAFLYSISVIATINWFCRVCFDLREQYSNSSHCKRFQTLSAPASATILQRLSNTVGCEAHLPIG